MTNPQLNIGNLDFDDIKSSLKEYLKGQDTFKDYNFEGSGISTLLDVLSYNTLYYAFYSNMIANEMFLDTAQKLSSVISLAKPLGYVVPGARSARARVQVRAAGESTTIPKYQLFTGRDETGRSYNFYTINQFITGADELGGVAEFDIYQGSKLFRNVNLTLTNNNTRGFIGRTDIDIRSLTVEVEEPGQDPVEWELSSSANENINSESKVYFLDRTDSGFYVIFSGTLTDGLNTGFGKPLEENSVVRVSYVTSSGELGNGVLNFTSDFSVIAPGETPVFDTVEESSGGALEPNLDAVKFFAPKTFGAQDRVVTKNDAIAVLAREFIPEDVTDSNFKVSVWGGEEEEPKKYGRFLFSFLSSDPDGDAFPPLSEILKATQSLQQKCVVSILPEYVGPVVVEQQIELNGSSNSSQTSRSPLELQTVVAAKLNSELGGRRRFNRSLKESDILSIATSCDPSLTFDSSGLTSKLKNSQIATNVARTINFKTPLLRNVTVIPLRSIQTTPTTGIGGLDNLQVVDKPSDFNTQTKTAPLVLVQRSTQNSYNLITSAGNQQIPGGVVGSVNYATGEIKINAGILIQPFDISAVPENVTFIAKQEIVANPKFTVKIEQEA